MVRSRPCHPSLACMGDYPGEAQGAAPRVLGQWWHQRGTGSSVALEATDGTAVDRAQRDAASPGGVRLSLQGFGAATADALVAAGIGDGHAASVAGVAAVDVAAATRASGEERLPAA